VRGGGYDLISLVEHRAVALFAHPLFPALAARPGAMILETAVDRSVETYHIES